ncbi:MAG: DNA repair protein RecN [Oscillospiraceae bacterium]|nr:DNA repair protein RecN [Oscillospiraceae bacterium]
MLLSLHIENIAVAQKIDIEFKNGFIVLTGETGAGKSIIISSLNLILGAKPSKDMIRKDEKKAMVSGLFGDFDDITIKKIEELGIEIDPSENCVLVQRDITDEGKSTSKLNGRSISVSLLKELAKLLINIHGQHDSQTLLSPGNHILFLDNFTGMDKELGDYTVVYDKTNNIKNKIAELSQDEKNKQRTIDLLKYQINDIDGAKLKSGEEEKLEETKKYIQNSEKIIKSMKVIQSALAYSEKGISAVDQMKRAVSSLKYVKDFIPDSAYYIDRLEDCISEVRDVAELASGSIPSEFEGLENSENSTARLDKIENRLYQISKLKAKYGSSIDDILEYKNKIVEDLDNIIFADEKIEALKNELADEMKKLKILADILSEKRKKSARTLEKKIMDELKFLEMSKVLFEVKIEKNVGRAALDAPQSINSKIEKNVEGDGGVRYSSRGGDTVEFLIATNPGDPPKPLEKIASGGELSRIMLAIKSVFARKDGIDTLIFDEIDSGISGRTAEKVGIKLKSIAGDIQVVCVTHSAQIASHADSHYLIEKHEVGGRSVTNIKELNKDERINEIARIMGGITITETVMNTAAEMINRNIEN